MPRTLWLELRPSKAKRVRVFVPKHISPSHLIVALRRRRCCCCPGLCVISNSTGNNKPKTKEWTKCYSITPGHVILPGTRTCWWAQALQVFSQQCRALQDTPLECWPVPHDTHTIIAHIHIFGGTLEVCSHKMVTFLSINSIRAFVCLWVSFFYHKSKACCFPLFLVELIKFDIPWIFAMNPSHWIHKSYLLKVGHRHASPPGPTGTHTHTFCNSAQTSFVIFKLKFSFPRIFLTVFFFWFSFD